MCHGLFSEWSLRTRLRTHTKLSEKRKQGFKIARKHSRNFKWLFSYEFTVHYSKGSLVLSRVLVVFRIFCPFVLQLPNVLPRGIHLASLFMSGVETAVFANDVCGAPIPWNMCLPWQFFDGKLFHFKLLKATNNTPLIDMCDGQVYF